MHEYDCGSFLFLNYLGSLLQTVLPYTADTARYNYWMSGMQYTQTYITCGMRVCILFRVHHSYLR